ncbi:MAG: hypothetical protein ABUS57_08390, partial [Pseudomonadota bacterium]
MNTFSAYVFRQALGPLLGIVGALAAVALLIVTIARVQYGYDLEEVEQRGLDVVVAVDTSKSML